MNDDNKLAISACALIAVYNNDMDQTNNYLLAADYINMSLLLFIIVFFRHLSYIILLTVYNYLRYYLLLVIDCFLFSSLIASHFIIHHLLQYRVSHVIGVASL